MACNASTTVLESTPGRQTTDLTRVIELAYADKGKGKEKDKEPERGKYPIVLLTSKYINTPANSNGASKPNGHNSEKVKVKEKKRWKELVVSVDGKEFRTRPAFDAFWEYASERHAVEERRRARKSRP